MKMPLMLRAVLPMLTVLSVLLCASPAQAQPRQYALDPARSWVQFELLHFGTSTIRGRIGPVQGQVTLDPEAGTGELGLRIPTASLSTGIPFFDARIRQDDLLSTSAWPEAFFVANRFRFEGAQLVEVRGEFTLRGVSQPLSLRALNYACRTPGPHEPNPDGAREVCGGDFEAEFRRSEFGASFALPFVGDRVKLQVQVEGRRR